MKPQLLWCQSSSSSLVNCLWSKPNHTEDSWLMPLLRNAAEASLLLQMRINLNLRFFSKTIIPPLSLILIRHLMIIIWMQLLLEGPNLVQNKEWAPFKKEKFTTKLTQTLKLNFKSHLHSQQTVWSRALVYNGIWKTSQNSSEMIKVFRW